MNLIVELRRLLGKSMPKDDPLITEVERRLDDAERHLRERVARQKRLQAQVDARRR